MNLTMKTRETGDVTIVDVGGRIAMGEESAALRDEVAKLISQGKRKILLNLAEVTYIDSLGLGILVASYASVRKAGGELKLMHLSEKASDLMQVTRMYTVFDIAENEAAAVASFNKTAAAGV